MSYRNQNGSAAVLVLILVAVVAFSVFAIRYENCPGNDGDRGEGSAGFAKCMRFK